MGRPSGSIACNSPSPSRSITFSAAHHGPRAAYARPEDHRAANRQRKLQSRRALLARIFAINFALGVVTGIPMEFQFGTNWAAFSRTAGGVIGQTLAMEGVFSFFLESSFLGLLLFGEKRLGPRGTLVRGLSGVLGSWLSGYLIVATDAWMQHPVGYSTGHGRRIRAGQLLGAAPQSVGALAIRAQHARRGANRLLRHGGGGAFYLLSGTIRHPMRRIFVRIGVIVGRDRFPPATLPHRRRAGRMIARYQPATLAAMEGLFDTQRGAPLAILGQPDVPNRRLDNPLDDSARAELSHLSPVDRRSPRPRPFPRERLAGQSFRCSTTAITSWSASARSSSPFCWSPLFCSARGQLYRLALDALDPMLALPFPYIANTAGWITAEVGRQPWLIYGLMRTRAGISPQVSAGNAWFTLIGFLGMYTGARNPVLVPGLPRNRSRPGPDESMVARLARCRRGAGLTPAAAAVPEGASCEHSGSVWSPS